MLSDKQKIITALVLFAVIVLVHTIYNRYCACSKKNDKTMNASSQAAVPILKENSPSTDSSSNASPSGVVVLTKPTNSVHSTNPSNSD